MTAPKPYWMVAYFAYFVGGLLLAVHTIGVLLGVWDATAGTVWLALAFLVGLVILGVAQNVYE